MDKKKIYIAMAAVVLAVLLLCLYKASRNAESTVKDLHTNQASQASDHTVSISPGVNAADDEAQGALTTESADRSASISSDANPADEKTQATPALESAAHSEEASAETIFFNNVSQLIMKDSNNGWAISEDGKLILTEDQWKTSNKVHNFTYKGKAISMPSISYADDTLFVAGFLSKEHTIGFYSSKDDGMTWTENVLDYSDAGDGAYQLFCSFIDRQIGYLLYIDGAALGLMPQTLYKTTDGGKTFQKVSDLSDIHGGYTTGLSFSQSGIGFLSCSYHGSNDTYLYTSTDQGKTWTPLTVQLPSDWKVTKYSGYINGYPPYFIGDDGYMILEYVNEQTSYLVFHSPDSGKTWSADGYVDLPSDANAFISNYGFSDQNTVYITDYEGNTFRKIKSEYNSERTDMIKSIWQ